MNDLQSLTDRIEIEALRGEFTDAAMMRDHDRFVSLFTDDAVMSIPEAGVRQVGREAIRLGTEHLADEWRYFVQTTHPGVLHIDGDTASGRAYIQELGALHDGRSVANFALFHDRYRRTPDGWKFAERVYEVRYLDTTELAGSPPPYPQWDATSPQEQAQESEFAAPASSSRLETAAAALTAHGFATEILDDVAAARDRVKALIPAGSSVLTTASETLRLSGIEDDINGGGAYQALKPRLLAMDRATEADEIRRLLACPDVVIGSVAAVTETGSLVIASGSGSQLPSYAGGAGHAIWIVGAQKLVPDLSTALRRVEEHALPLENVRALEAYGQPSAVNRLLVLNADPRPGRATVLLLREAIGF